MTAKVERPDRKKFEKDIDELKAKLSSLQASLKTSQEKVRSFPGAKGDPEWQKLLDELNALKLERETARGSVQGVQNQVRNLDGELQKKNREVAALRPKTGPKSDEEFTRAINALEKQVETGQLKLVEEKKAIREIGALRTARKSVSGIPKLEGEAAEIRQKIAELRKSIDDSALKKANAAIDEVNKKLDARKSARSEEAKLKSAAWEHKRKLEDEIKDVRKTMDETRETFNTKNAAWREATAEERKQKAEAEKAAAESAKKAKKLQDAQNKIEAAKEPAFASQIVQAESLLAVFAPRASSAGASEPSEDGTAPKTLQKPKVERPASRKALKRKTNTKAQPVRLDVGIIESLTTLNIAIPGTSEEAADIAKKLQEKIEYYHANNERVTKERVERAQSAFDNLKQELDAQPETPEAE